MQLHLATGEGNAIGEVGAGFVVAGGRRWSGGVIVSPEGVWEWPPMSEAEVCVARLEVAAATTPAPEVALLGVSDRLAVPHPEWSALFAARGIGLEVMTTAAACRTYNILASDGRAVMAALTLSEGG